VQSPASCPDLTLTGDREGFKTQELESRTLYSFSLRDPGKAAKLD